MSADLFLRCSDITTWKRLTDRPLAVDQRVSLIADLFSDRGKIEVLKGLSGDDAQPLIDMMDEVRSCSHVRTMGLLTWAQNLRSCWVGAG